MIMPVKAKSFTQTCKWNRNFSSFEKFCTIAVYLLLLVVKVVLQIYLAEQRMLWVLSKAVENAGYKFGDEVKITLDCAAAEFFCRWELRL
jgi:enolase